MGKDESGDFLELKHRVIDKAREQVTAGAHYLWATAGATPGNKDGATYRPGAVLLHPNVPDLQKDNTQDLGKGPPFSPMLFAAWADTSNQGKLVCMGRAGSPAAQQLPLAAKNDDVHAALRLTLKKLTPELIDELKKSGDFKEKYRWPRQQSPLDAMPSGVTTVWGESCIGKRHFDCIGLVNYCFSYALNKIWQYGVESFADPAHAKAAGFIQIDFTKAAAGDIVTIDKEHIGLVTFEGTAIEAKDIGSGVVEGPLDTKYWKQCYRLPAGEWKPGP